MKGQAKLFFFFGVHIYFEFLTITLEN